MAEIQLKHVYKKYENKVVAVQDLIYNLLPRKNLLPDSLRLKHQWQLPRFLLQNECHYMYLQPLRFPAASVRIFSEIPETYLLPVSGAGHHHPLPHNQIFPVPPAVSDSFMLWESRMEKSILMAGLRISPIQKLLWILRMNFQGSRFIWTAEK